jgi:hypothetical protein
VNSQALGYSGTPLAKKLGIKAQGHVLAKHAPPNYLALLAPLPDGVVFDAHLTDTTDLVHVFVVQKLVLAKELASARPQLRADAALWISWPKKASKVPTDITEDTIRELALPMGWVDVKVCAVSETWSGLKLVIRKALR